MVLAVHAPAAAAAGRLAARLRELWELTGDDPLLRASRGEAIFDPAELADAEVRLDAVSTALMGCFQRTGDPHAFALLFELNRDRFLHAIQARLRRSAASVDAQDVVQEMFLNIYRYPGRFQAERPDSFRNWGHRIARNTVIKSMKVAGRDAGNVSIDAEPVVRVDPAAPSPLSSALRAEVGRLADRAYLLYLTLYLAHFERLTPRERRALTLVEVESCSYQETARQLGLRLENLKMVIFRGRRKILRGMAQTLERLGMASPDAPSRSVRPSRPTLAPIRTPLSGTRTSIPTS